MKIDEGPIDDEKPQVSEQPTKRPEAEDETSHLFDQLNKLNEEKNILKHGAKQQQEHAEAQRKNIEEKEREMKGLEQNIEKITSKLKETNIIGEEMRDPVKSEIQMKETIKPEVQMKVKVDDVMPNDVNELKLSGNKYFKQGQYGEALDTYTKAISKLKKGIFYHSIACTISI